MKATTVDQHRRSVLIVDNTPVVRSFLRTALEFTASADEAADAEAALATLNTRADAIDLVFVDHVLPGRSGLELLRIVKTNWPSIPVVIVTAFGSEELAVQALRGGASDYLRKPIDVRLLRQTVDRLILSRELRSSESRTGHNGGPHFVHPNIFRALGFMNDHFAEDITLADVAREAGLSRFHFCRLFRQEAGVLFHEHLTRLRLQHAKTLLADRNRRISEVAYGVGFNDLSHFDRTFRKMVGRSPSEYRSSLRMEDVRAQSLGRPRAS